MFLAKGYPYFYGINFSLLFMKLLFTFLIILGFVAGVEAQSLKLIETDLVKSFKKIPYFNKQRYKGAKNVAWDDSLAIANEVFAKTLQQYTTRFPATIAYPFSMLKKEHLGICTSSDGLFRIYSWDNQTGGTMYFFDNVYQFKTGTKTFSNIYKQKDEGDAGLDFYKIYMMKVQGKTYYIGVFLGIESSRYHFEGVNIFAVEDGKLNDNVKLIKTKSGLRSLLSYEYDVASSVEWKNQPEISFDATANAINFPLVAANGKMTQKFITYKFTGQYFERIKN